MIHNVFETVDSCYLQLPNVRAEFPAKQIPRESTHLSRAADTCRHFKCDDRMVKCSISGLVRKTLPGSEEYKLHAKQDANGYRFDNHKAHP